MRARADTNVHVHAYKAHLFFGDDGLAARQAARFILLKGTRERACGDTRWRFVYQSYAGGGGRGGGGRGRARYSIAAARGEINVCKARNRETIVSRRATRSVASCFISRLQESRTSIFLRLTHSPPPPPPPARPHRVRFGAMIYDVIFPLAAFEMETFQRPRARENSRAGRDAARKSRSVKSAGRRRTRVAVSGKRSL